MTETIKPTIGLGCTIHYATDRLPATIIDISNNEKTITIREDTCIRTDSNGFSEVQEYVFAPNPHGLMHTASLRKDGQYRIAKTKLVVSLGERSRYFDYSF